jgi:phage protein D
MTAAIPIYTGQDFYVPAFLVELDERPLGQNVIRDIVRVSYKDNIEEVDSFELTVNNWDAAGRTFKYSDEDLFVPGKRLQLWMGYQGQDRLRLMLKGEITSLRPSFPASGQPTLTVGGLNLLHRFRGHQRSFVYENKTDSKIAKQVGSRLKVTVRTDRAAEQREPTYTYILQENQYDLNFLIGRARRVGYDLFVVEIGQSGRSQDSILFFGPSDGVSRITYELTWGKSLIDFQPNLTTANQVAEVVVRGWDPVNKRKIEATATRSELKTKGVGQPGGQDTIDKSFSQRQEVIATRPIESKQEAKKLALETLERIAKDMVKATGTTIGLPDLRAGSVVMLEDLGTRFSGRYFLTATTHAISDAGYTTQFECRREELQEA